MRRRCLLFTALVVAIAAGGVVLAPAAIGPLVRRAVPPGYLAATELRELTAVAVLATQVAWCFFVTIALATYGYRREIFRGARRMLVSAHELTRELRREVAIDGRGPLLVLLGLTVLGLWLRLQFISQPMRYDEAYTVLSYAKRSLLAAAAGYSAPNNQILHTLLVGVSIRLFGDVEWAARLPAFVAGVLLVPATYLAGRLLSGWRSGLVAAGLVAVSSELILFSTNARGYSIAALLVTLVVADAALLRTRSLDAGWVLLAILAAFAVYTVPVAVYPLGGVVLWLSGAALTARSPAARLAAVRLVVLAACGAAALALLLYLPAILASAVTSMSVQRFVAPGPWPQFLRELRLLPIEVLEEWCRGLPTAVTVLAMLGALAAVLGIGRPSRRVAALFGAMVVSALALLLVGRRAPPARTFLPLLPMAAILVGSGIGGVLALRAPRRVRDFAAYALAAGIGAWGSAAVARGQTVYRSNATGTLSDAPEIARTLRSVLGPNDRVVAGLPSSAPLMYYLERQGISRSVLSDTVQASRRLFLVVNEAEGQTLATELSRLGAGLDTCAAPVLVRRYRMADLYELRRPSCGLLGPGRLRR